MKKLLTIGIIGAFLIPGAALAAVSVDNALFDGAPNVAVAPGTTVNTQVYITNDTANDVESLFVTFPDSGGLTQQGVCYNVSDEIGLSPVNGWVFDLDIKVPSNSGVWDMIVSTHGTNGDAADQNCSTSADDTTTFTDRVTVLGSSTNTGTGNSASSGFDQVIAMLTALIAKLNNPTPAPTPAPSGACGELAQYSHLSQGSTGQAVVQLQGLLLSKGASIPALAAGASFGFYGPQTAAALTWVKTNLNCN